MEELRTKDLVEEVDQEEKSNEKEVVVVEEEDDDDDGDDDDDDNDDNDDNDDDDDEEVILILCEIVGARNLVCGEVGSDTNNNNNNNNHENATTTATWDWMQPFCVVKLGETIIHRTQVAFDPGCHPIWTISTNSLFVLKITLREVLSVLEKNTHNINNNNNKTGTNGVLSFALYTQNKQDMVSSLSVSRLLGTSEQTIFLGKVDLDVSKILLQHCNEQRLEVDLLAATAAATAEEEQQVGKYHHHHHQTHKNRETLCVGSLAVRFRLATRSDQRIMERFHANSKPGALESITNTTNTTSHEEEKTKRPLAKLITETDESEVAQSTFVNAISNVFFTTDSNNTNNTNNNTGQDGEKAVRVKPSPDPNRVDETTFLTPQRIRVEAHLPSHQWVEAGSGSLGKLYVEILSCHDLPNVDLGEAVVRFYLCIYQSIKQSIHVLWHKKSKSFPTLCLFPSFFFVIRAI